MLRLPVVVAGLGAAVVLAACGVDGPERPPVVDSGSAARGRDLISTYGCAGCHEVPGVDEPGGRVGPPLSGFGGRATIAGRFPNTPDRLIEWITDPQELDPGVDMPDLGVSDEDARDIAAYLTELR